MKGNFLVQSIFDKDCLVVTRGLVGTENHYPEALMSKVTKKCRESQMRRCQMLGQRG